MRSVLNHTGFLLMLSPVFLILGCTTTGWTSSAGLVVIMFFLSLFGASCRKPAEREDLTGLLFRYILSLPRKTTAQEICTAPQDFTNGFDLNSDLTAAADGFSILGWYPGNQGENAGRSVHGAGDVNGDGFEDIVLGAPDNTTYGGSFSGVARVVFGSETPANVDLSNDIALSGEGFTVYYSLASTYVGNVVRGAGDVNGDGFADVLVGAQFNGGTAFVIFGKETGHTNIDVSSMSSSEGIRINSSTGTPNFGFQHTMDGAGDFNGDGYDDIILGTSGFQLTTASGSGAIILYGKPTMSNVDVYTTTFVTGADGVEILGTYDSEGESVAYAGDVNGDGIDDVLIGSSNSNTQNGSVFVVFGQSSSPTSDILLSDIKAGSNTHGFLVNGPATGMAYFGEAIGPAGDINGDGFDDIALGYGWGTEAAVIVYGSAAPTNVALDSFAADQGFKVSHYITGDATDLGLNETVHGDLDINGDGVPDLAFGSPKKDYNAIQSNGMGHVLFGNSSGMGYTELSTITQDQGFALSFSNPAIAYYNLGESIAPAGDVNGDGCSDLLIGMPGKERDLYSNSGAAYIIFGGVQQ